MGCRGLHVFSHESPLGNAPAHGLLERITAEKKSGVDSPRRFTDYVVTVNDRDLPKGVTLSRLVG
jgi:CRISPR-associated protein Csd2